MTHIRQKIVEVFEDILIAELGGDRVSQTSKPIEPTTSGVCKVMIGREIVETRDYDPQSPVYYDRTAMLVILIGVANPEQTNRFVLDEISKNIEHAIARSLQDQMSDIYDLVEGVNLTEYVVDLDEGSRQIHTGTLTYQIDYTTLSTNVTENTY